LERHINKITVTPDVVQCTNAVWAFVNDKQRLPGIHSFIHSFYLVQ